MRRIAAAVVGTFLLAAGSKAYSVNITEIYYDPPPSDAGLEWVELFNDGSSVVDLSGWRFTKGITFEIPEGTMLPARGYLVIAANAAAVQARHGISNVIGNYSGKLSLDGETLELANKPGIREISISYRDRGKWPSAPRGTGHTLSIRGPYLDADDGVSWRASLNKGGTPGKANFATSAGGFEETEIIATGAPWKYRKGTSEFSNPVSAWRAAGFNDATWLSGPTGIGYGDGDDATVLDDMQGSYASVACRRTFSISAQAIAEAEQLVLSISYDDGFVAYLNGTEAVRAGLGNPGDPTPFDAAAADHEAGVIEELALPKSALVAGQNVLAVQVHNNTLDSSDLSFLPRLFTRKSVSGGASGDWSVLFNELFARTAGERWLELYNRSSAPVSLAGHGLSDDPTSPGKHTFSAGTVVPGKSFLVLTEAEAGLDFGAAEVRLYLSAPDGRVLEARIFENQGATDRSGTSDIRYPDGEPSWAFARQPTRGNANQLDVEQDLVINEILYHPMGTRMAANQPYEEPPGEFIEIYNKGTRSIPLAGFRFTQGIDYAFPAGLELAPGAYAVVAQDPAWLGSTHGISGVLGPWTGALQNDGETIKLEDALGNAVDEVKYADGGDWSELADGGGSSLELADPRSDNAAGGAWEPSDETQRAPWTQFSYTGAYLDFGEDLFRFTPVDSGVFLLDDVEILRAGTQYVEDGGFENGTNGWLFQGAMVGSQRVTTGARSGSACMRIVATDRGDLRMNRVAVIPRLAMAAGTYTVRFWARWVQGSNMILTEGFDNDLPGSHWLPVPRDVGTPGRENSATAKLRAGGSVNAAPILKDAAQRNARPRPGEAVTVSVTATDPDGISSVRVFYRLTRRDGPFTSIDMAAASGVSSTGGRYSAALPGQASGARVLYYFEARDGTNRVRRYPASAPGRTLLYQTGDPETSPLIQYRLVLDQDQQDELESRPVQSDDPVYGAFVFDDAEIYQNVGAHYHGSPWERPGTPRSYTLKFPGDKPLQGTKKFVIRRYGSNINDTVANYTVGRNGLLGAVSPYSRFEHVRWEVSGEDQGILGRLETVDKAFVKRWFPGDGDGLLFRPQVLITLRVDESWEPTTFAHLYYRGPDKESYRWIWDLHSREFEDDWTPFTSLMQVIDGTVTQSDVEFEARFREIFDVEEFARVISVRSLNADEDSLGFGYGHNAYFYYAPIEGKWSFLPWDMDSTFGDVHAPLQPTADQGMNRILRRPAFFRSFLQAQRRSLVTTWREDVIHRLIDPSIAAGVDDANNVTGYIRQRRPDALAFVERGGTLKFTTNGGNNFSVAAESTVLAGEAPISATFLAFETGEFKPSWIDVTRWQGTVPLVPGPNRFDLYSFDDNGNILETASITVTSTLTWQTPAISSVTPSSGTHAGGTLVTINGSDFHAGAVVKLGSANAVVQSLTAAQIKVVTPPGSGPVDVRVTNLDGKSAVRAGAFTYSYPQFIRGDATGDSTLNLTDAIATLEYLFRAGSLDCLSAADANDDGSVDISDPVRILLHLFATGVAIPAPYPATGPDPTPDTLPCTRG